MRFTDTHKSMATYPPRYRLMAVRGDGYRDLEFENEIEDRGDIYALVDHDPVVALELNAEGLEFLISQLPPDDGYTQRLEYIRELARFKVWDREAS